MMLLLSDNESPACLSCAYFRAILARDLVDYACSVMGCPFILCMYQHTLQGKVGFHCRGYAVTSVGLSESLRDTLHIGYRDRDGGLLFLFVTILLVLGRLECTVPFP